MKVVVGPTSPQASVLLFAKSQFLHGTSQPSAIHGLGVPRKQVRFQRFNLWIVRDDIVAIKWPTRLA